MIELLLFFFITMCISGLLITLLVKEMMLALGGLLITLLGVSGLMVLALADFNAVVQLMVYVGGVLILLIFGYMMSNRQEKTGQITIERFNRVAAYFVSISLLALLTYSILTTDFELYPQYFGAQIATLAPSSIEGIGILLFTKYLIPFEIAGLFLLVALIYATTLTKE
jgi:NADH-quinone oxidoreductase subunit J